MPKGAETRERIVDRAFRLAGRKGLEGLSLGELAADLGLSKSGLFAHFGSKEELQMAALEMAARQFEGAVVRPALEAPSGLPRVRSLFENWLAWVDDPALPGGCPLMAASFELDDRSGEPRDFLVRSQREMLDFVAGAVSRAKAEGHLRGDVDAEQVAVEVFGIALAYSVSWRLLRDPGARRRAERAFDRLIAAAEHPSSTIPD